MKRLLLVLLLVSSSLIKAPPAPSHPTKQASYEFYPDDVGNRPELRESFSEGEEAFDPVLYERIPRSSMARRYYPRSGRHFITGSEHDRFSF